MTRDHFGSVRSRVQAILGDQGGEASGAEFSQHYHEGFQQSGIAKADWIISDLRKNRGHVDLARCAYFGIGGSTGDEIAHVLRNTEVNFGLLLEYNDTAAEYAREKSRALKEELSKTLLVVTGDATQKLPTCKSTMVTWREKHGVTGLIASAQAVLHELPARSPGYSLVHFLGEVLWDWVPCLFYCREPCSPSGWPDVVRVAVVDLPSTLLEQLAIRVGQSLKIDGSVKRAGPHEVIMQSALAVEVLHKLFYIDDFAHEIGERLTSVDCDRLVGVLESYMGPSSVQPMRLNTDSFARLYSEYNVAATDEEGSTHLPAPLSFVAVIGERKSEVMPGGELPGSPTARHEGGLSLSADQRWGASGQTAVLRAGTTGDQALAAYVNGMANWGDELPRQVWDRVDTSGLPAPSLSAVHVPLATRERIAVCEDTNGVEHRILPKEIETSGASVDCAEHWQLVPMLAVETVRHYSRVLLVGRGGLGKTTTLRYLALLLASGMMAPNADEQPLPPGLEWVVGTTLPVRLVPNEFRAPNEPGGAQWKITSEFYGTGPLAEQLQ